MIFGCIILGFVSLSGSGCFLPLAAPMLRYYCAVVPSIQKLLSCVFSRSPCAGRYPISVSFLNITDAVHTSILSIDAPLFKADKQRLFSSPDGLELSETYLGDQQEILRGI